jgi:hypothetical protein
MKHVFTRWRDRERMSPTFELGQVGLQPAPFGLGKTRAHVTDVDDPAALGVMSAQQQATDGAGEAALSGYW